MKFFENKNVNAFPPQYQNFKDIFKKNNVDILSQHRSYDCVIELQKGKQPPLIPMYNLSQMN
jgi:hypothetical protein